MYYGNYKRTINENEAIEKIKDDSKFFYKYAKNFSSTNESIGPLIDDKGNIVNGSKNMADLLSKQYKSVFSTPRESYDNMTHHDYNCNTMKDFIFNRENIKKVS